LPEIILLHKARNVSIQDNILLREGLRELRRRLPSGWSVSEPESAMSPIDAVAEVTASDRRTGPIALEARSRLDPKGVLALVEAARNTRVRGPLIVVARYLSEATRARLREREVGYLDLTGNVRIVVREPGLFIETQGATEDPDREERHARSLRGAKAGRIVRALIDHKQPPGVRELAAMTKIDAGYVSRVLAFLDSQALVKRRSRTSSVSRSRSGPRTASASGSRSGPRTSSVSGTGYIEQVDWPALLRRWAQEAPIESRGKTRTYLEPRGLSALVARLAKSDERYAITGGLAAAAFAPVAPARLFTIWIRDAAEAATRLGLRPAEAGANTLLIEPGDEGVFDGVAQRDGIWYAAPSQVAADLLTSPGRGPAEGEELINWMLAHEEAWRR
jgi:hypothetical protein